MRLEQLKYLVTVLERGSFRLAAEALHLSQPALSESIKNLERDLGAHLMDRDRSGVRLTKLGHEVVPHIRAVLEAEAALRSKIDDHRGLRRGELRIGTVNAATNYLLGPVLAEFHASYPEVQLRVTESGSLDIVDAVKSGDFEMGLVVESDWVSVDKSVFDTQTVLHGPVVACVPRGHHLLARDKVKPSDVAREPLILFRPGYFMSQLLPQVLSQHDLNVVYYTNNTGSAKRMIAAGVGITLLPTFSVVPDSFSKTDEISYLRLTGQFPEPRLTLIRRRSVYASSAVRELWSAIEARADDAQLTLESLLRARPRTARG